MMVVNDRPIGVVKDDLPLPFPWLFEWRAPWGIHPIKFWCAPGSDPGVIALVTANEIASGRPEN